MYLHLQAIVKPRLTLGKPGLVLQGHKVEQQQLRYRASCSCQIQMATVCDTLVHVIVLL